MILIKILLLIILYAFLTLLGLLLILIISPIKGKGHLKNGFIYFSGSYLFGAIRVYYEKNNGKGDFRIKLFGFNINTKTSDSEKLEDKEALKEKEKKKKENKKYGIPGKKVIALSLQLVKKLIKKIAPKNANLHLLVGLDDPYYASLIQMASQIVFMPLNRIDGYRFNVTPEYMDWAFEYEISAEIHFSVIGLIVPVVFFLLKKPVRAYLGLFRFKKTKEA